jgi:hypothetical protein
MFIPDPDFFPSQIQEPKTGGEKIYLSLSFFKAINEKKLEIILFLYSYIKKFEPIDKELKHFLRKKFLRSSQKYVLANPDQGCRGQKSTGSRIQIHNTGVHLQTVHGCYFVMLLF